MRLERRHEPLLPRTAFLTRMAYSAVISGGIVMTSLAVGVVGYRWSADLGWTDALLNAAMILTGMGPVSPMQTTAAKLFASAYALFSGIVFITSLGVLVVPLLHRLLHHFHLDPDDEGRP